MPSTLSKDIYLPFFIFEIIFADILAFFINSEFDRSCSIIKCSNFLYVTATSYPPFIFLFIISCFREKIDLSVNNTSRTFILKKFFLKRLYFRNKHNWLVDEQTASIVKRIFNLCMQGYDPTQIVKILTKDNILTPSSYYKEQGLRFHTLTEDKYKWV